MMAMAKAFRIVVSVTSTADQKDAVCTRRMKEA